MPNSPPDPNARNLTRRDFLYPATAGLGLATIGVSLWGLGSSVSLAEGQALDSLTIDVTDLAEGAEVTVKFMGKPFVIRHRSPADIAAAEAVDPADLVDPFAQNLNLTTDAPATDQNRRATPDGRIIVLSRICTHLGCVVLGDRSGDFNGYFCPCHGAQFDTAGRVRRAPAQLNLQVPAFEWQSPGILTLLDPRILTEDRLDSLIYGAGKG